MTTWDNLDSLPKEQRHAWYQDMMRESELRKYAEYVVTQARELEQYLFKTLGGDDAPLRLTGEDVYAEGAKERLQDLRQMIHLFDEKAKLYRGKQGGRQ